MAWTKAKNYAENLMMSQYWFRRRQTIGWSLGLTSFLVFAGASSLPAPNARLDSPNLPIISRPPFPRGLSFGCNLQIGSDRVVIMSSAQAIKASKCSELAILVAGLILIRHRLSPATQRCPHHFPQNGSRSSIGTS